MCFSFDRVNYKRWAVIDLALKMSIYPKDIMDLFSQQGVWRGNITENLGSFMSLDMLHETSFNAPLKSAIHAYRQSEEILENLSQWLVYRGKFVNEWKKFFHPGVKWIHRNSENYENIEELKRYNQRMKILQDVFEEKILLTYDQLEDDNFKDELSSFAGQKLSSKDILNTFNIGNSDYEEFVETRIIKRTVGLFDPIKKRNIEVFKMTDDKSKKKKAKSNHESLELKNQSKLIKIAQDRPIISMNDLEKYQLTQYNALVTSSDKKDVIPNMNSNKSKVASDYLSKLSPEAFCAEKPQNVGLILIEGENVIATSPGSKKTISEHCEFLFIQKLKPLLQRCNEMMIMFDDSTKHLNIKNTDDQRYAGNEELLILKTDFLIDDWNMIFKNKQNKIQFKKIFVDHIMQICGSHMSINQTIYFNGTFDEGKVMRVKKMDSGYCALEVVEGMALSVGESDMKIFEFSLLIQLNGKILEILSLDTDVKVVSLYWSTKYPHIEYVIRSGSNLVPSYFYPRKVVESIKNLMSDNRAVANFVENLLFIYALFGCDYIPTFYGISHSFAMKVFEEIQNERSFNCPNDFLWLILEVYERKNATLKKMFLDKNQRKECTIEECILTSRGAIKSVRGSDLQTIPLPSVLMLQVKRADLVRMFWTGRYDGSDPCLFGYCR